MEKKDIEAGIEEIFKGTFSELEKGFEFEKSQGDFENWDSFSHMELVSKVEEKFGVSLEMEEVVELDTPRKFVGIVEKKLKG